MSRRLRRPDHRPRLHAARRHPYAARHEPRPRDIPRVSAIHDLREPRAAIGRTYTTRTTATSFTSITTSRNPRGTHRRSPFVHTIHTHNATSYNGQMQRRRSSVEATVSRYRFCSWTARAARSKWQPNVISRRGDASPWRASGPVRHPTSPRLRPRECDRAASRDGVTASPRKEQLAFARFWLTPTAAVDEWQKDAPLAHRVLLD
jgi:hypothetical protein